MKGDIHCEECSLATMGLITLFNIFQDIRLHTKQQPIVVSADLLRKNPLYILTKLCESLSILFSSDQLAWPSGPKPVVDGLWANYWYDRVHQSTNFSSEKEGDSKGYRPLTQSEKLLYRESLPFFQLILSHAIGYIIIIIIIIIVIIIIFIIIVIIIFIIMIVIIIK